MPMRKDRPIERNAELRGQVPKELLQLIDAVMQAEGLENRMDVCIPVLWDLVEAKLHSATLLVRMAGVNPSEPESERGSQR